MTIASNLGFPRIGANRQLKKVLEEYWSGKRDETALLDTGSALRRDHWRLQQRLGLDHIPSNDFSLYDHVLDTIAMVGAIPARYDWRGDAPLSVETYFAMARGSRTVPAMEMTKWFDTNYHYMVPEFERGQRFSLSSTKPIDEFVEAQTLGLLTRPVLLGPVSFLLLGKAKEPGLQPLSLLDSVLTVYEEILRRLADAGAEWVQIDEPCLCLDLEPQGQAAFVSAYARLSRVSPRLRLLLAAYFDRLGENLQTALHLPVSALHLDLVRAPEQLQQALTEAPRTVSLSLGVVDGRNIWRTDLDHALGLIERAVAALGEERVLVAPSCPLLHVPFDCDLETDLDDELRGWLAFAKQKIEEVALLSRAHDEGAKKRFTDNREAMARRSVSPRIHNDAVQERLAGVTPGMLRRKSPYPVRRRCHEKVLSLPLFPTTTIGSFPQTEEVRSARALFKAGKSSREDYTAFLLKETEKAIRFQEEVGLDVLVHGEFERNDMVEYFGERLSGFAFTQNGWVQSYGSRCVKPPIIYGDVARPKPMTVEWSRFAQSLTKNPVKGMLTGPVTILKWSFVRDDQPLADTCRQIALAIRDEVSDLIAAGIRIVQIDEPAIREVLPLRRDNWKATLDWAVEAFRLATSGVPDEIQIHTHMCYSEFNDIMEVVGAMDADVLSIETSRSQMELLGVFTRYRYPSEIGPGAYDIHSPRVPSREEMVSLLHKAKDVLSPSQIWVNPDCGLKTRRWEEVRPALAAMVEAAKHLRAAMGDSKQ